MLTLRLISWKIELRGARINRQAWVGSLSPAGRWPNVAESPAVVATSWLFGGYDDVLDRMRFAGVLVKARRGM